MAVKSKKIEIQEKRRRREKVLKREFKKHLNGYMQIFKTDLKGLEKISRTQIQLELDEAQWIDKKLKEFDEAQPKIPQGKYRDDELLINKYQEHFMRYIQELCPEVLDELNSLSTNFQLLFNDPNEIDHSKDHYLDCFDSIYHRLIQPFFSLGRAINYQPRYRSDFLWGNYLPLIGLLNTTRFVADGNVKSNLIDDEIKEIVNDLSYISTSVSNHIRDVFQRTAGDKEKILENFIVLQGGLINWAIKYQLQKDWVIKYAYYFLWQFCEKSARSAANLEIKRDYEQALIGSPFEFIARGWVPAEESAEDYLNLLAAKFNERMENYFDSTFRDLNLGRKKKVTKPEDFSRVKWLVRTTVQGWTVNQVLDEIALSNETPFSSTTVYTALRKFRKYDLPHSKEIGLQLSFPKIGEDKFCKES